MTNTTQGESDSLRRAAELIKQGQKAEAKQLIAATLKSSPKNARAWYLASYLTEDKDKRIQALERALAIDPQFEEARQTLNKLRPPDDLIDDLLATSLPVASMPKASPPRGNTNTLLILAVIGLVVVLVIVGLLVAPRVGLLISPTATRTPTQTPSSTPTNTFTPTSSATATLTPTLAITATLTPSATSTPGPVTLTSTTGEATAVLYSSPGDYIGGGRGNFTLKGAASISFDSNSLQLSLTPEDDSAGAWNFEFSAPDMQTNKLYDKATRSPFNDSNAPGISVNSPGRGCNQISGQFTIEQQSPVVVISFTHLCEQIPGMELKGTITFTPLSMLTPTPTVPADKILQITSGPGEVTAELSSSPDDWIGGGQGNFTLKGPGNVNFSGTTLSFGINPDDPTLGGFGFQFYAPVWVVGQDYEKASRIPFNDKRYPGINITSTGRGCNTILGNFKVEQQSPTLIITFTQHCEGGASALTGKITFIPLALLTPTPTIPPEKLFAPAPTLGQFKVEIYSAPNDPVGKGRGNITLAGPGDLRTDKGVAIFSMTPVDATDENWRFNFFAAAMEIGQNYDVKSTSYGSNGRTPYMNIGVGTNNQDSFGCSQAVGQFTIEQQSPTIVISFSQLCSNDPNQMLKGTLTFTPDSASSPTPTLAPDKVFAPAPTFGELSVEMDSEGTDPLGGGQGKIAFKGPAKLLLDNGAYQFSVTRADNPDESWRFSFFSASPELGKLNDNVARWPNNKRFPAMSITAQGNNSGAGNQGCNRISGSFTFEKQSPTIEISFTHLCEKDASRSLSGKITFTPLSQLTATPTIAPAKLFKPVTTTGNLHLEFDSSPQDRLGGGRGHVVLDGPGTIQTQNGTLTIQMMAPESWYFSFYAPSLQIGHLYDNVRLLQNQTAFPSMAIGSNRGNCSQLSGQFQIEKSTPLVISFTHLCDKNPDMEMKGKLTFTPLSMLTPTPTVAPDKLFVPKKMNGTVVAVLSSDPGEYIGGGQGDFTLEGTGLLTSVYDNDPSFQIILTPQGGSDGQWRFSFYAPVYVVGQDYQNATRFPFNNKQLPGIDIDSPGRGCNTILGEFKIVKKSPTLVISFVQACEGDTSKVLKGTITFTPTSGPVR